MSSIKASVLIIAWVAAFLASVALSLFSTFFAGVAVGALLTAVAFGLTVRWSIAGLTNQMTDELETVQENLEPGVHGTGPDDIE